VEHGQTCTQTGVQWQRPAHLRALLGFRTGTVWILVVGAELESGGANAQTGSTRRWLDVA